MQPSSLQILDAASFPASTVLSVPSIIVLKQQWKHAYMQPNWIQALDADILMNVLNASAFPATKEFPVPAIIVLKQQWMQAYMQPNWIQILDAEKVFQDLFDVGGLWLDDWLVPLKFWTLNSIFGSV